MEGRMITDVVTLKKYMLDAGYEQIKDLSSATKINRKTLGEVLSGKAQPSALVMARLVQELRIPPEKAGTIFFARNLRST